MIPRRQQLPRSSNLARNRRLPLRRKMTSVVAEVALSIELRGFPICWAIKLVSHCFFRKTSITKSLHMCHGLVNKWVTKGLSSISLNAERSSLHTSKNIM